MKTFKHHALVYELVAEIRSLREQLCELEETHAWQEEQMRMRLARVQQAAYQQAQGFSAVQRCVSQDSYDRHAAIIELQRARQYGDEAGIDRALSKLERLL